MRFFNLILSNFIGQLTTSMVEDFFSYTMMCPGQQLKMVMGNHPFFYFPLHIDTAKNKEAANHQYAIYNFEHRFSNFET